LKLISGIFLRWDKKIKILFEIQLPLIASGARAKASKFQMGPVYMRVFLSFSGTRK
jgi:hypothetical protein